MAVVNGYDIEIWAQLHGKPCYYSYCTELYYYARLSSPQFIVEISNKPETLFKCTHNITNQMKKSMLHWVFSTFILQLIKNQKLGAI